MITLHVNDETTSYADPVAMLEDFRAALDRIEAIADFELWIAVPGGPSLAMLRNPDAATLVYLREDGDSGFASLGDPAASGATDFVLGNGQVDEFPMSDCISVELGLQAVQSFFVDDGARPAFITWVES